ncbi:LemA family protein [Nautilia lithotrophica]
MHFENWMYWGGGFVLLIFIVMMYNSLIARKNMVENMYGAVDALLKKRVDMIPNLIASVKEYMQHERDLLTKITEIRSQILHTTDENEKIELESRLSGYLRDLMVNVENYPQLRASENFMQLQNAIKDVEDQISAARRAYNQAVTDYNNAIEMFPTNILASMMGYTRKKVFEIPENERENINVADYFKG